MALHLNGVRWEGSYKWKCWDQEKWCWVMWASSIQQLAELCKKHRASETKSCIKWINQICEKLLLIEISKKTKTFFINICFASYPLRIATSTTTTTNYSHSSTPYSWDGSRDLLNPPQHVSRYSLLKTTTTVVETFIKVVFFCLNNLNLWRRAIPSRLRRNRC